MNVDSSMLKESEIENNYIINNIPDVIGQIKLDSTIMYVSVQVVDMFGRYPKELIGKKLYRFIHLEDIPAIKKAIKKSIKTKDGFSSEFRVKHKSGDYIFVSAKFNSRKINGEARLIGSFRVISERKESEDEYKNDKSYQKIINNSNEEILRTYSEAKHWYLFETAVMGLIEIDLIRNKISYINPKLLETIEYKREELLDDNIFYKLIHLEDIEEVFNSYDEKDLEFRIFTKDGKLKWLSGIKFCNYNDKGKLISLRMWLQDITESKELEQIKANLLTRFSHEFKTPLISIKGFSDFLLMEYRKNLDEKTISFLKRIKEGCERLKLLINSFLRSSQLDNALVQLNLSRLNLSDLIKDGLEEMEGLSITRKHTISLDVQEKIIMNLDKEKIYTVITNLLLNAIKYTPKGGNISVQSSVNDDLIIISVKDDGIGLNNEDMSHLFKPFGKIERYGKGWDIVSEGMGMGLYISKEIIDLHGGKIWAESEGRSKGTNFHFSLPLITN